VVLQNFVTVKKELGELTSILFSFMRDTNAAIITSIRSLIKTSAWLSQ